MPKWNIEIKDIPPFRNGILKVGTPTRNGTKNYKNNQIADTRVSGRPSPCKTLPYVFYVDSVSYAIRATT